MLVREIKRGRGPAVRAHDMVFIDYIEGNYRTGNGFNRSWAGGQYATTGAILTPRGSARGLLAGMKGMRPGARRQIVAPPRLGGLEQGHADYHVFIYWDVVLRKILARGCSADGKHCRSITP